MTELIILGLETSCDETAAAVVRRNANGNGQILSNIVHSQLADHAPYGGVVPEIAARAHVQRLDSLIAKAMAEAGIGFDRLDGVAATAGGVGLDYPVNTYWFEVSQAEALRYRAIQNGGTTPMPGMTTIAPQTDAPPSKLAIAIKT